MTKNYFFLFLFFTYVTIFGGKRSPHYAEWTVVGAGPAGITAIGILHDLGIPLEMITWVDPLFSVGRIGEYYQNVPGNAKNKNYVSFLESCKTFQLIKTPAIEKLYASNLEECGFLSIILEPLQDITNILKDKVHSVKGFMDGLYFDQDRWHISIQDKMIISRSVILATGSKPKVLDYPVEDVIPLDYAIDKETLSHMVKPWDTIAVVGSAHSAILVLKILSELNVKQIINFYKQPITYAVDMGTWILNLNGLKGSVAAWAKEYLEKNLITNILRIENTPEHRKQFLPLCNKIIYAIGYEKNSIPLPEDLSFDSDTGLIGPRLFGIGIAFAPYLENKPGEKELSIGLNSFMKYAQKLIPEWLLYKNISEYRAQRKRLEQFQDLFNIYQY